MVQPTYISNQVLLILCCNNVRSTYDINITATIQVYYDMYFKYLVLVTKNLKTTVRLGSTL